MTARELLADLESRGVTVKVTPHGNIWCKPKPALMPEDIASLKEHKQRLIKVLASIGDNVLPSPPSPPSPGGENHDTYGESGGDDYGDGCGDGTPTTVTTEIERAAAKRASDLGLVARWSYEFGFISIHDPTTGEWYDLPTKEAPDWSKRECFKRRELRKLKGITRLLSRAELEEVWASEQPEMWDHPAVTERGIVYEDYLLEEDD